MFPEALGSDLDPSRAEAARLSREISEMFTCVHLFSLTRAASAVIDSKSTEACHEKRAGWRGGGHCWGGQKFVTAASFRLLLPVLKQLVVHTIADLRETNMKKKWC